MQFWTTAEVIKYLKRSKATFYNIRRDDPTFPRPVKIQGTPFYTEKSIRDWEKAKAKSVEKENARRLRGAK
jgi:predicted DNA-binding transcriptional regulator AlpA